MSGGLRLCLRTPTLTKDEMPVSEGCGSDSHIDHIITDPEEVFTSHTGSYRLCVCATPVPKDVGGKAAAAQRRHCQCMVISGLISQTYLLSD